MAGKLYVVATPLGNLDDLSRRAVEVLRAVACIACEDTRRTARLLAREEIRTATVSCHRFNERARLDPLVERLRGGADLALVSDGGAPGIADPGALLVRAAVEAGIPVVPVPGPSAVTALLMVSGLPGDRFVFDGFLPHRAGERRRRLRALAGETRPVVLYEAPHRIRETLADLDRVLGSRPIVLGRELTKLHETIYRGSAAEIARRLPDPVRGELCLAIGAAEGAEATDVEAARLVELWRRAVEECGGDTRDALRRVAREAGLPRAEAQRRLVELGER